MTMFEAAAFLERVGSFKADARNGVVVAASGDRKELQKLVELFGGNISGPSDGSWEWRLEGERASKAMQSLYFLMNLHRRAEIDRALEIYRRPDHWQPLMPVLSG